MKNKKGSTNAVFNAYNNRRVENSKVGYKWGWGQLAYLSYVFTVSKKLITRNFTGAQDKALSVGLLRRIGSKAYSV